MWSSFNVRSMIVAVLNCLACSGLVGPRLLFVLLLGPPCRPLGKPQPRPLMGTRLGKPPSRSKFIIPVYASRLGTQEPLFKSTSAVHLHWSRAIHHTMGPNYLCGLWRHLGLLSQVLPLSSKSCTFFGRCSQTWYRNIGKEISAFEIVYCQLFVLS